MENHENLHTHSFELQVDKAYAETDAEVWQAIRVFNELKVVDLLEIDPEDRTCSICMHPYDDLENGGILHVAVRLPCSHVFGKVCLAEWITPFGAWKHTLDAEWEEAKGWFETQFVDFNGSADCPFCRRELFPKLEFAESAVGLETRLMLFDRAYEKVGCLRSELEEQTRADMIRYVEFNRRSNGDMIETSSDPRWNALRDFHLSAMQRLWTFVVREKSNRIMNRTRNLTDARILQNLHAISIEGIDDDPMIVDFTEHRSGFSESHFNDVDDNSSDIREGEDQDEDHDSSMDSVDSDHEYFTPNEED